VVGGAWNARILFEKVVLVLAGLPISFYQRDGTYDSSKPANDANDAERSTDSSFVPEKALRGGASGGSGINGGSGVGTDGETARHG